jgi:hypothetical protein
MKYLPGFLTNRSRSAHSWPVNLTRDVTFRSHRFYHDTQHIVNLNTATATHHHTQLDEFGLKVGDAAVDALVVRMRVADRVDTHAPVRDPEAVFATILDDLHLVELVDAWCDAARSISRT